MFVKSVHLRIIRVIGHKTGLSTSQVTATNLRRVTGAADQSSLAYEFR